jgi:hypothetical protein
MGANEIVVYREQRHRMRVVLDLYRPPGARVGLIPDTNQNSPLGISKGANGLIQMGPAGMPQYRSTTTGMNVSEYSFQARFRAEAPELRHYWAITLKPRGCKYRERSSLRACLRLCIGRCVDARRCGIAKVQDINAGPIQRANSRGWYCNIRDNRKTIPPCGDLSGLLNADDCHQFRLSHQGRTRSQISLPSLYHRNDPIAEVSEIGSFSWRPTLLAVAAAVAAPCAKSSMWCACRTGRNRPDGLERYRAAVSLK